MKSILSLCFFGLVVFIYGQQGPFGPGTATTSGSTSYNWTNPSNALTDNTSAATATIVGANNTTNLLRLTNFGFSIPIGATINGILVEIRMQGTNGRSRDQTIQLKKAAGPVGSNKARKKATWPKNSARYVRFGGAADLWGTSWSHSDINNSAFGIDIAAKARKNTATPRVEYVRITVYFNQNNFYSKATGNLNLLSSWGTNTDGSGTAPGNFTSNNQVFNLRNRATVTLADNLTISGTGSRLVVGNGSNAIEFTIPSGFTYTGEMDVSNNATVNLNNATLPTLGQISRTSNGGSSTISYGASTAQNVSGRAYHNLIISGASTKTLSGTGSTEGTLTINSSSTFSDGGSIFTVEGNITNSGTHLSSPDGVLLLDGASSQTITGNGIFGNLEIYNTNGVTISGSITISGNLLLEEGALAIGSNTLTLNGTITNVNGTISGGTNSNMVIGGSGSLGTLNFTSGSQSLNNLTVNRTSSGIVTLGTALNVRNILTMTSGDIHTGSNTFTLGTSTSSRGTLTRTSGLIFGSFTRWFTNATNSGTTGHFPVGTLTDYRPVTIEFTSSPTTGGRLTAQFIEGDPGNVGLPLNESAVDINKAGESGVWQLTPITLSGGNYTGTFTGTNFTGVLDYSTLHLVKRTNSASSWLLDGTHQTTTGSNVAPVLRRTVMSGFGEFGIGGDKSSNPLPVTMLFFRGEKLNNKILLHWATASEVNNDFFELELSKDGITWSKVANIPGNGNSNSRIDYYYYVVKPINSSYYRLKQVDFDGQFEHHEVILIEGEEVIPMRRIIIHPNPVSTGEIVTIELQNNYEQIVNVTLNSLNGAVISKLQKNGSDGYKIPELQKSNGQVYLIIIETTERFYAQKISIK
ncbi:hypothetical protein [Ekhidna sp.]|uniref:hypothetical protein n=1 Tax=Ekhidna sp. TaxID=2608089 RepID=UPI00351713E5